MAKPENPPSVFVGGLIIILGVFVGVLTTSEFLTENSDRLMVGGYFARASVQVRKYDN